MTTGILEHDGEYRIVTFCDDGKFNPGSLAKFNAALDACLADDEARALVLTGQGKMFAQGLDLDYLGNAEPASAMGFVGECLKAVGRLLAFPLPVVSAVNGHAFGLGAMIVLASDYKVMREDKGYFCLPEIDMGITLTYRMNALVSGKLSGTVLRDALLAGKRINGPEALARGIVDQCSAAENLMENAKLLAEPMKGKSRSALGGLKRGINQAILQVLESEEEEKVTPAWSLN